MKVTVNEQAKKFYLAAEEWVPFVGHEIKIDDYSFSAIPFDKIIRVSDVVSGAKFIDIPINLDVDVATSTKESTMQFLHDIGEKVLVKIINETPNFDERMKSVKERAYKELGVRPPIEDIDEEMILADTDSNLH